jgi:hypothetical protein
MAKTSEPNFHMNKIETAPCEFKSVPRGIVPWKDGRPHPLIAD